MNFVINQPPEKEFETKATYLQNEDIDNCSTRFKHTRAGTHANVRVEILVVIGWKVSSGRIDFRGLSNYCGLSLTDTDKVVARVRQRSRAGRCLSG